MRTRLFATLALIIALPAMALAQSANAPDKATQNAIRTETATYFNAIASGDTATLNGLLAPGYTFVGANGTSYTKDKAYDALRPLVRAAMGTAKFNGAVSKITTTPAGVSSSVNLQLTGESMGTTGMQQNTRYSTHAMNWVQSGGKWLVAKDTVTSAVNAPQGSMSH